MLHIHVALACTCMRPLQAAAQSMHLHRDHPYSGRHLGFKGLLELGGASVQVTFMADGPNSESHSLQLPGLWELGLTGVARPGAMQQAPWWPGGAEYVPLHPLT